MHVGCRGEHAPISDWPRVARRSVRWALNVASHFQISRMRCTAMCAKRRDIGALPHERCRTHQGDLMKARARLLGHPIHQMLIVFPLGLLATAVVFDLIAIFSDRLQWWLVSYWMMAAGII